MTDKQAMSWAQVLVRVRELREKYPDAKFYGVPRGGAIVAGLLGSPVDDVREADVIVDDIVDSGQTERVWRNQYPDKPFEALVRKTDDRAWVQFPWEHDDPLRDNESIGTRLLQLMQEDPRREGLRDTPKRFLKAMLELTSGERNPEHHLDRVFSEQYDEMVVVRDIPFVSICEHHLLPFTGKATVAYIPNGKVVGLSKIPRVVQAFARRPQVQERLTTQVADALQAKLNPVGVAVRIEGRHSCMSLRGVRADGCMTTQRLLGAFRTDHAARAEFLALCNP